MGILLSGTPQLFIWDSSQRDEGPKPRIRFHSSSNYCAVGVMNNSATLNDPSPPPPLTAAQITVLRVNTNTPDNWGGSRTVVTNPVDGAKDAWEIGFADNYTLISIGPYSHVIHRWVLNGAGPPELSSYSTDRYFNADGGSGSVGNYSGIALSADGNVCAVWNDFDGSNPVNIFTGISAPTGNPVLRQSIPSGGRSQMGGWLSADGKVFILGVGPPAEPTPIEIWISTDLVTWTRTEIYYLYGYKYSQIQCIKAFPDLSYFAVGCVEASPRRGYIEIIKRGAPYFSLGRYTVPNFWPGIAYCFGLASNGMLLVPNYTNQTALSMCWSADDVRTMIGNVVLSDAVARPINTTSPSTVSTDWCAFLDISPSGTKAVIHAGGYTPITAYEVVGCTITAATVPPPPMFWTEYVKTTEFDMPDRGLSTMPQTTTPPVVRRPVVIDVPAVKVLDAAPLGTVILDDTFTGGGTLAFRTPDIGLPWVYLQGAPFSQVNYIAGDIGVTYGGSYGNMVMCSGDVAWTADYTLDVIFSNNGSSGDGTDANDTTKSYGFVVDNNDNNSTWHVNISPHRTYDPRGDPHSGPDGVWVFSKKFPNGMWVDLHLNGYADLLHIERTATRLRALINGVVVLDDDTMSISSEIARFNLFDFSKSANRMRISRITATGGINPVTSGVFFDDTFTGTGALDTHVPDIGQGWQWNLGAPLAAHVLDGAGNYYVPSFATSTNGNVAIIAPVFAGGSSNIPTQIYSARLVFSHDGVLQDSQSGQKYGILVKGVFGSNPSNFWSIDIRPNCVRDLSGVAFPSPSHYVLYSDSRVTNSGQTVSLSLSGNVLQINRQINASPKSMTIWINDVQMMTGALDNDFGLIPEVLTINYYSLNGVSHHRVSQFSMTGNVVALPTFWTEYVKTSEVDA